jgi:ketosteroid isomerase-like protein
MHQLRWLSVVAFWLLATGGNSVAQSSGDAEAVRAANQSYYAALSARDIRAMEQVWSQSPDDVNVAPPVRPAAHVGWPEVKKNYSSIC